MFCPVHRTSAKASFSKQRPLPRTGTGTMCTVTPTTVVELPNTLRAPAEARDLAARAVCKVHAAGPATADLVALLTSELVTGALPDAPRLRIQLECRQVHVRLEVRDRSARTTRVAGSGPRRNLNLLLVALLATE